MGGVKVELVGEGAFVQPSGDSQSRPFGRGAQVEVDKALADQLIADGVAVAVKGGKPAAPSSS